MRHAAFCLLLLAPLFAQERSAPVITQLMGGSGKDLFMNSRWAKALQS
jgi:hypothetical protein